MKCPYRTVTIHQPERVSNYTRYYAKDIVEYADCYGKNCPFYDPDEDQCVRVEKEKKTYESSESDA